MSPLARRWALRAAAVVAIAAAVHAAAVWAVPRAIMHRVIASIGSQGGGGVYLPPMTDAAQRGIVMPSPDLAYALCAYDVGAAPLRVRAEPRSPGYWSIALYAANSDNFFVVNDRRTDGRGVDLLVVGPTGYADRPPVPDGATLVASPTARGLLLMRVLVRDSEADRDAVEAARRTLRCERLR